ncbi:macro domain-containing protein [Egicoccus sp. AB-alg6-2]|uniref:macro domain-containing protein n=1 Tax=Egicoccus sp. AB-alg6-2 TaxID=3242692 RepID=UPI00359E917B
MDESPQRTRTLGTTRIVARTGDLTAQDVDAIVNAANAGLQHGGGVAGALARAAGPTLQAESDEWIAANGPLRDGVAAVTAAGDLPSQVVVHVAGPIYQADRGDNADRLRSAVLAALDATAARGLRTIAFPAISAGIYGYPRPEATRILVQAVADWTARHPGTLDEVRLVGFDAGARDDFAAALASLP